jgi:hypothetical protein
MHRSIFSAAIKPAHQAMFTTTAPPTFAVPHPASPRRLRPEPVLGPPTLSLSRFSAKKRDEDGENEEEMKRKKGEKES